MPKHPLLNLKENSLSGPLAPCDFPAFEASFASNDVNNYFDFSDNNFSGKLELPCLRFDPCSSQWRPKLDNLLLKGNNLCGICSIKC